MLSKAQGPLTARELQRERRKAVPAFVAALGDSTEDRAGKFAILTAVRAAGSTDGSRN